MGFARTDRSELWSPRILERQVIHVDAYVQQILDPELGIPTGLVHEEPVALHQGILVVLVADPILEDDLSIRVVSTDATQELLHNTGNTRMPYVMDLR